MTKKLFRRIISISKWSLIVLSILPVNTARASDITVTGAQDFYFTFNEPTTFTIRADAIQYGIDSHLWLYRYNSDNTETLVAFNDDHFGLDSYLEVPVESGEYRLRAGVCCGDPNRWYGDHYYLSTSLTPTAPPTTVPETTTTWEPTTTSTTTTTTTTTTAPPTTVPVTEPPTTVGTTTTTEAPTTTTSSTTTSTTTEPPVETTVTSVPQTTSTIGTTVAPIVVTSTEAPITSTAPPVVIPPPASTTSTTTTVASTSTSTSIPESTSSSTTTPPTTTPIEDGQVSEEEISNLSSEELADLVESVDVSSLTEESIAAVFSDDVLDELSDDQITELIDAIDPAALTDDQAQALSEALTNAPTDVKQEFESQINVFGGQFDSYVPTGSTVPVGARRVIVAATAVVFAMPTPTTKVRK